MNGHSYLCLKGCRELVSIRSFVFRVISTLFTSFNLLLIAHHSKTSRKQTHALTKKMVILYIILFHVFISFNVLGS